MSAVVAVDSYSWHCRECDDGERHLPQWLAERRAIGHDDEHHND